jgi:glycosyltransferase involved in cell wall biosynthesis
MKVDILLATYNGAGYLRQQLESLAKQNTQYPYEIIIGDDGSTDETMDIITAFKSAHPTLVSVHHTSKDEPKGPLHNFSRLMRMSNSDYSMFCDQDDMWDENKVETTISIIHELELKSPHNMPVAVFCDMRVIDRDGHPFRSSFFNDLHALSNVAVQRLITTPSTFLVTNFVSGTSLGFNRSLRMLTQNPPAGAYLHDCWVLLVGGLVGKVAFIPERLASYRLHGRNTAGAQPASDLTTPAGIISRLFTSNYSYIKRWEERATLIKSERQLYGLLSDATRKMIDDYSTVGSVSFVKRKRIQLKYGVPYRRAVFGLIAHLVKY